MIPGMQGRVRWILIVWIFIISSVAYLDRVNISIASHYIVKEYHLSNIQLGYIFSAFVLGYALFQAPGGRVSDRYGAAMGYHCRYSLVGGVHELSDCNPTEYYRRSRGFCWCEISAWRR